MNALYACKKKILVDESPIIYKKTIDENWQDDWIIKCGEWHREGDKIVGIERGNKAAVLLYFHADTYMNFNRFRRDMSAVKHVLITHSHHDHFMPSDISNRRSWLGKNMTSPTITFYCNRKIMEDKRFERYFDDKNICMKELKLFERGNLDEYTVTPLRAVHAEGEDAFVFLIEKGGKTIFYCNDTGLLPEDSLQYLKEKKIRIDFIGFDCTFGTTHNDWPKHMGLDTNVQQYEILKELGVVHAKTQVILTHFSHWNLLTHEELEKAAKAYGFGVAYDGVIYTVE